MLTTASAAPTDTGWPLTTVVPHGRPPVSLPGEATAAAGLVIVPHADTSTRHYTGLWSVIHARTGIHVGPNMVPLVYAREATRLLADTGVDWTAPGHVLADPARALIRVVARLRDQVLWAWDDGRPAWWARPSWTHVHPAWEIGYAGDGWARVDTWAGLVDRLTREQNIPWLRDEIAEVTREDDATWRLTCAAPLCGSSNSGLDGTPAVLASDYLDYEDSGGEYEIRYPDRGDTAREARAHGWTRHDPWHWTCPACTAAHTRAADPFYGW